ncbi:hypothetical protein BMS3Abin03_01604 [bacterium BMS3Abin03]|nr:hypothetical protein BMS3Abin03_01604 [bacterium BMS3Abin03]
MIKKFKYIFIFTLSFLSISYSQNSSTYTRNGIGDMDYTYSARSLGLGHTGVSMLNRDYVEILNPASWAAIKLTRIELSLVLNGVSLSNSSQSGYYADADFKGFTFAFPISNKYGIGFASGLVPYSRISYKVVENFDAAEPGIPAYTTIYEGKGGLTRLFMGASYTLPFGWVIGGTAEYYFGTLNYKSNIDFSGSSFKSGEYDLIYRATGFGSTVGLITQDLADLFNSETISNLRIGVSANIVSDLNTDTSLTTNPNTVGDTISSGSTIMKIPIRITGGITLGLFKKYNINIDYIYQPWSEFKIGNKPSKNLRDVYKLSGGFEYKPVMQTDASLWEQIVWRLGLSYEISQYRINGTDITQYSAFGGLSFPLSLGNSVDLGFEYSLRGTTDSNLIREKFYRINVGISFGELWFIRVER